MSQEKAEVSLTLEGLHCAACVARVERALKGLPGVAEAPTIAMDFGLKRSSRFFLVMYRPYELYSVSG